MGELKNRALFQLFATNYGGDGKTTFGVPDLRGRVPVAQRPAVKLAQRGGKAHENRQPYLSVNFIISTSGDFPNPNISPSTPSDPFYGEVRVFGFDYQPRGWMMPFFNDRVPLGFGQGPGCRTTRSATHGSSRAERWPGT